MSRDWNFDHCQQCFEKGKWYIMSMYDTRMICEKCKAIEEKRPDYKDAVDADEAAIRQGNFNFKGIGAS